MKKNQSIVQFQEKLTSFLILITALVGYNPSSTNAAPVARSAPVAKAVPAPPKGMMVRISEIEIFPRDLARYQAILKEESEASIRLESGVIAIFPMYQKDNPAQVRILEIYASREAYQAHLKTPHFQKYKSTTLKMVKALKLVDMGAVDGQTMPQIFKKMKGTSER